LKKINEELEKLSDEQLEQIASGAMVEFESYNVLQAKKPPTYQPGVIIG